MKRLFLALALLAMFAAAVPASAQNTMTLDTVRVQLWPEYDQQAMLVIYSIDLPADVELPAQVSVRIPASVGEPNAVAVESNGTLMTAQYQRTVSGDWADILVDAQTHNVHVEYYDTSLQKDGSSRSFTYTWPGNYAVNTFILEIQQPYNATDMAFSTDMGDPQPGADGLNYYVGSIGSVDSGQSFDFKVTYTKSSNRLSVDAMNGEGLPWWFYVVIGLGTVLVLAGAYFLIRGMQQNAKPVRSKKTHKRSRKSYHEQRAAGGSKFCHNCGSPIQPGDKFCRECGEKIRV